MLGCKLNMTWWLSSLSKSTSSVTSAHGQGCLDLSTSTLTSSAEGGLIIPATPRADGDLDCTMRIAAGANHET